jgi:hypothetical protein
MLLIAVICITVAAVIQFWRDQLDAGSIDEAEWIHIGLLLPVRGLLRRLASAQSAIHRALSEQCSPAFPSFPDRSCSLALIDRAGVGVEIADKVLVVTPFLERREAEFLVELHSLSHCADSKACRFATHKGPLELLR